jgi:hypothetical protein
MAASLHLEWVDAWNCYRAGSREAQQSFAVQLERVNGGFVNWIATRPHRAQLEIISNAPEGIVSYLYNQNALSPRTVMEMNLQPAGVRVIDMRTRR